jgi:hypothetical protein
MDVIWRKGINLMQSLVLEAWLSDFFFWSSWRCQMLFNKDPWGTGLFNSVSADFYFSIFRPPVKVVHTTNRTLECSVCMSMSSPEKRDYANAASSQLREVTSAMLRKSGWFRQNRRRRSHEFTLGLMQFSICSCDLTRGAPCIAPVLDKDY